MSASAAAESSSLVRQCTATGSTWSSALSERCALTRGEPPPSKKKCVLAIDWYFFCKKFGDWPPATICYAFPHPSVLRFDDEAREGETSCFNKIFSSFFCLCQTCQYMHVMFSSSKSSPWSLQVYQGPMAQAASMIGERKVSLQIKNARNHLPESLGILVCLVLHHETTHRCSKTYCQLFA